MPLPASYEDQLRLLDEMAATLHSATTEFCSLYQPLLPEQAALFLGFRDLQVGISKYKSALNQIRQETTYVVNLELSLCRLCH
jgi:hypothetical protein